ncbi:MAG: hypothetical protein QG564_1331 [Campylobacterota bacterium]|nr:hypothetical protein [Campylobacterota bacterium]
MSGSHLSIKSNKSHELTLPKKQLAGQNPEYAPTNKKGR